MDIRCRPRLSLPPDNSKELDQDRGHTQVAAKADSLYYCGLQARIAPFVLAKQRDVVEGRNCLVNLYGQRDWLEELSRFKQI